MVYPRTLLYGLALLGLAAMSPALGGPAGARPAAGSGTLLAAADVTDQESERRPAPAAERPDGVVLECDLAVLVARIARQIPSPTASFTVTHPLAPVSRLRALAALVKLGAPAGKIASFRAARPEKMPPDAAMIPTWGQPFVAAAIDQDWWPADRPLHARQVATWAFVDALLSRMLARSAFQFAGKGTPTIETGAVSPPVADGPDTGPYTGLIVDAREFDLQRAMGPRILDEEGQVLYPDPKHVPDMEVLQDHGMAAYVSDAQNAPRSGSHPLVVRAASITGPGHDDLVIPHEAAQQIRQAEQKDGFLARWAVSILVSSR